jgi:signal transduction histidine kinase/ActR/RegA family two-component response regulator
MFVPSADRPALPSGDSRSRDQSARSAVTWESTPPRQAAGSRLERVLELAGKCTEASRCGIGLLSPGGELTEFLPCGPAAARSLPLKASPGLVELAHLVLRQAKPLRLEDTARGLAELGIAAGDCLDGPLLAVPLTDHGEGQGVLYLTRAPGAAPFRTEHVEQALGLCRLLDEGNLAEEMHLLDQVRLLTQLALAAAGNLDLTRIFTVALRELERYLPLNACAVWLAEDDQACHVSLAQLTEGAEARTTSLGLSAGLRLALDVTSFIPCWRDGQAVYGDLRRPEDRGDEMAARLATHGATYFFAVPLRAGDRTVGVLQSICRRPTGFTGEQIQLLYRAADLLGPAISNCQLFARLRTAYEQLHLTQKQLVQSEKMRALGELASGMAHDFNNSLCGVVGFLELTLLDQRLPAACRRQLDSARTCALDAAQTVRRVQEFARRERDQRESQPLDVNALVRETAELTRPRWEEASKARGRPIHVEIQTEARAAVLATPAELREALTNLIFNAVDAMPEGGTLELRTASTAGDVFLAVRDHGVGMSEPVRRRLFEPFFTTKGENGNGLGLSVTFGIVQRHGGEITVESAEGRGSTFTIRLPAAKESARPSKQVPVVKKAAPAGPGLRVLVVEDEESIRRLLETVLKHLGHRPHVTATAGDGLAAFGRETFDVVLTDLGLPDASGEEVARAVARQAPGTPVVLLTGWADQLKSENRCPAGVVEVLGKPVTLDKLAQTLGRLTAARRDGAS